MSLCFLLYVVPSTGHSTEQTRDGLKILCFDGGGVKGKAALVLLKDIMDKIGTGAKPCDFFDLIAGTSTGGLIAILLARLGYSVDEAIGKYDRLGPRIFASVAGGAAFIRGGNPLIHEDAAEKAFREVGREGNTDGFMNNEGRCKV